ncbi:bifunctional UDP-sugar hydrolase/5'-nucleotidase UshA [Pantoea dispersa]|uniref:Bifunctional UDP-sugar hydrolase/5'-nucleotidase n=1 Tax=Pantoea dispersa TaxID=59814 RepID=A0ABY2ZWH9_9GAMM|nr:bifunctional UDP-sugar hydrolase/5'-nucleotidase UshA [Pantoea dispersa]MBS0899546.1 bifunctional UDP-sugar hydrolase/5'-nucleotidase [Pantoea dispersa]MCT6590613.1 bifunctional UDP-sugar hydrolase/5'-nucleotidase UshA [Pantoea dispersa]TQC71019.1 bifunctional UDP-sugar hydrolase/5'-nucleotidase [Pantoea dispersa]WEA04847.1 bifunctional UDP-sugar hydrolase/5'-nucleotidase UshA [Pantoea dispersa]
MLLSPHRGRWLALIMLLLPLLAQAWQPDRSYRFSILHTNDHHGHFWANAQGEYGLAAQKTLMDQQRYDVQAKGGGALILSAGDVNTGVPESDVLNAEPDIRGMNLIGYDAMALGNHEFDKPLSVLQKQQKWAKFPFLAANIYAKGSDKRLFKPWAIFNRMGLKIAVIGLTTTDTLRIANPQNVAQIEIRDPVKETEKAVAELRASDKPDVIIALTHMGHYDDGQHGSNAPGDVELARSLPPGTVNVIVGGHSHDAVCMAKENVSVADYQPGQPCQPDRQNGVWIVQAKEWGKFVGRGDFTFRNGELTLDNYQLIPVNLKHKVKNLDGSETWLPYQEAIAQNGAMMKLLTPYQLRAGKQLAVNVGRSDSVFDGDRSKVRFEQMPLAQLILRAQMAATQADFAVISGGGIRTSLAQGEISWRDLLQIQPFGNQVVSVTLTGKELLNYLATVANIKADSGGFAQFSNISLVADGKSVSAVKINGEPLQLDKTYRMATNSFNASGGDGYPVIDGHAGFRNSGLRDAEVLRSYVSQHSPLRVADYAPPQIVHLTPQQVEERDKALEKQKKRSYPQMILAWIWPRAAHE